MCGRFAFYSPDEAVIRLFDVTDIAPIEARYNLAPTQNIPVLRVDPEGARQVVPLRWGLVPFWAKDSSIGNRMINARAETVAEKPAFRRAFAGRRCLVLASGFYEWQRIGERKQPFYITREDGDPFAMAGLWESWRDRAAPDSDPLETCTIVTTGPNALMAQIHSRMPVILDRAAIGLWLDTGQSADSLAGLLVPSRDKSFIAVPVSTRVNNSRNEGADLIEPVGRAVHG